MQTPNIWLHRFSMLVIGATLSLIFIGGLVTTKDAGMSVPDWPTTFHFSMFSVPFTRWISEDAIKSGVFYEHSHRLFASIVGLLTVILAGWIWAIEQRPWMKLLGFAAVLLVIAQGVLGGLRVTHSSTVLAMIHGCAAQAFLCVLVLIAFALSSAWTGLTPPVAGNLDGIFRMSWLLAGSVYVQLVIGAVMRHLKAGLAIPSFPQSGLNGEWIPPYWNTGIALNFAHRVGALVITLIVINLVALIFSIARKHSLLVRPAAWLSLLVLVQVFLGANIILKLRPPTLTTLHVVNGAALLATSFLLAIRVSRLSYENVTERPPQFSPDMRKAAI